VNTRVIARDWEGVALDRIAVGADKRVIYIASPEAASQPVGFPKEDVYAYRDGMAGRKLSESEWGRLTLLVAQ